MPRKAEPGPRLPSWSYSTHKKLAACPASAKYAKIDRLPDPSGPYAERGSRVHAQLEEYVKAWKDEEGRLAPTEFMLFPPEFAAWRAGLDDRLEQYQDVQVELELAWDGVTPWRFVPWREGRGRAKLDLVGVLDDVTIEVTDYKTGRRRDEEHAEQLRLYALLLFLKYAWCTRVLAHAWYLDDPGNVLSLPPLLRRTHFKALEKTWRLRYLADLSRTTWPAVRNPGCRWCNFSSRKGGPCVEG